ncbi:tyrosine-type recombinase/integrase [Paraburkholderia sp. CNPSo 3076]|uniref:tyrosine-type recombinase/integrase n=1 Tax=Paraburkholderia sp. CNPSo 3076 TaxID=2940936 RepID=UPI00224CB7DF|nr:tyrosine-type recombinase/integrase [Paraburkholderia sp. CNPSo 3076]MCX5545848.1 tyrosine-type recombinase/integrase [Paraburkholderia sp. CNPSo 3076]
MPTHSRVRPGHILAQRWFSDAGLGAHADSYCRYLTERGYRQVTVESYFRSVAHFVHWISGQGMGLRELSGPLIDRFLYDHLPHCHCAGKCKRTGADMHAALMRFLEMPDVTHAQPVSNASVFIARELADFDHHLMEVCGLADSTRSARKLHVGEFLVDRFGTRKVDISRLKPDDVSRFVLHRTRGLAPGTIRGVSNSLRRYFRFKASHGIPTTALIAALPRVPSWRLAGLPDVLSAVEIRQLLSAFDHNNPTGMRDYAITRCLLDLGLRRTEVAHLCLGDIDWRAGTLNLHSKGGRIDIVPLPQQTGEAIARYLRDGRPQTTRREVFVRHRPPLNTEANLDIVRNAVRYAAERCGLQQRVRGTHIFRYTMACRMTQVGTPFKEIADVLRHRCLDTTSIYAKLDVPSLRRVALPWPGRVS